MTLEGWACELKTEPSAVGCDGAQRCMPDLPTTGKYCVWKTWQGENPGEDCPAPYDVEGTLLYAAPSGVAADTRACAPVSGDACQCNPPTEPFDGACTGGVLNVHDLSGQCSNPSTIVDTLSVGTSDWACTQPATRFEYDATNSVFTPSSAGACPKTGTAELTGGVTFDDTPSYIVCCGQP
jgi:hypothetical protein